MSDEASTPSSSSSSDSIATGRQAENINAGLRNMPDPPAPKKEKTFANAREAGKDLDLQRQVDTWGQKKDEATPIEYRDDRGKKVDSRESITIERGADDLIAFRKSQSARAELDAAVQFDQDVDLVRAAEGFIQNPQVEAEPRSAQLEQPQHEAATNGLAPEVQAALKHPQIREAIQQEIGKAQESQAQYSKAVEHAHTASLHFFGEAFSEFKGMTADQVTATMQQLARTNPQRFQQAFTALQKVAAVETAHIEDQKRQHEVHNKWLADQDRQFEARIANRTPAQRAAIGQEVVAYARELGVSKEQFVHAMRSNPVLRSVAIQTMITDAVEARLARKAVAQQRNKAAPVPAVAKPGNGGNRGIERGNADLAALSKKISEARTTEGSLRAAAALLSSKRSNRGR